QRGVPWAVLSSATRTHIGRLENCLRHRDGARSAGVRCIFATILAVSAAAPAEEIRIEVSPGVVKTVDLEDYVAGVVTAEVPPSWPAEALKAQAVAARTFAVAQKVAQGPGARAHLTASVLDQVYKGTSDAGAQRAARETKGEVLTWGAAPIAAYF